MKTYVVDSLLWSVLANLGPLRLGKQLMPITMSLAFVSGTSSRIERLRWSTVGIIKLPLQLHVHIQNARKHAWLVCQHDSGEHVACHNVQLIGS